ncbi:MAG: twin-arginine translocase subunit TatC [Bacteroidota bacterium]
MPRHTEAYLPFWEHLEVLRWHIIRSLIAILGLALIAFLSREFVFHTLVLGPSRPDFWTYRMLFHLSEWLDTPALYISPPPLTLQSRHLAGQFIMHIRTALIIGSVGAFPYVLWELWHFVKPGITLSKYSVTHIGIFTISFLFALGALFGYYIITPLVIYFLASYQLDPSIVNRFDIASYVSTVGTLTLTCAFIFQLPVVMYFLAKIGMVTAQNMRNYRKHACLAILILAAIMTPPDVVSQLLIAAPLLLLYECSILITQFVANKDSKQ